MATQETFPYQACLVGHRDSSSLLRWRSQISGLRDEKMVTPTYPLERRYAVKSSSACRYNNCVILSPKAKNLVLANHRSRRREVSLRSIWHLYYVTPLRNEGSRGKTDMPSWRTRTFASPQNDTPLERHPRQALRLLKMIQAERTSNGGRLRRAPDPGRGSCQQMNRLPGRSPRQ